MILNNSCHKLQCLLLAVILLLRVLGEAANQDFETRRRDFCESPNLGPVSDGAGTREDVAYNLRCHEQFNSSTELFQGAADWEDWTFDVDRRWEESVPPVTGGKSPEIKDGIPYTIAILHQMHCVAMLRHQFVALLNPPGTTEMHRSWALDPENLRHAAHCFNRLQQV